MKLMKLTEKYVALFLLVVMGVIVIFSAIEVAYTVIQSIMEPPGFFIGLDELFDLFGLFLMVLIGLELMTSIHMLLEDQQVHAEIMFIVALTAVTRKIVILDAKEIEPMTVFAIGFLVIALSGGYYLLRRQRIRNKSASAKEC